MPAQKMQTKRQSVGRRFMAGQQYCDRFVIKLLAALLGIQRIMLGQQAGKQVLIPLASVLSSLDDRIDHPLQRQTRIGYWLLAT